MLIILEGVDGTFKTTVGKALNDMLNLPLLQGSSFESAKLPNDELFAWYLGTMEKSIGGAILDRFVYSNLVYASIYEDYSILTGDQAYKLEELMKYHHGSMVLVVYLFGHPDILEYRLSKRGDEYVKKDKIPILLDRYDYVMRQYCRIPYLLRIDTGYTDSKSCAGVILGQLNFMYWINRKDDDSVGKDYGF